MSPTAVSPRVEELLQHADWVKGLAHRLVSDAARAEDLVQQTWLCALERPPRHAENLRGWLGRVVTQLARSGGRSEKRRAARERAAARSEALPSLDGLVAEATLSRELVDTLLALAEPYRTVLLLRYFRDLSPPRIARELDRPLATVKTQLQRGLALMRERLDQSYRERRAWCMAFLPLARAGGPAAGLGWWIAPAAVALVALATWGVVRLSMPARVVPASIAREAQEPEPFGAGGDGRVAANSDAAPRAVGGRESADALAPVEPALPAESPGFLLRGRLVDLAGEPLAGIELEWIDPGALRWADAARTIISGADTWVRVRAEVRAELLAEPGLLERYAREHFRRPDLAIALLSGAPPPSHRARTGAAGEFELRVPERGFELETRSSEWAVLGRSALRRDTEREAWFAVRRRTIAGQVLDARGEPCADLEVSAHGLYPERIGSLLELGRGFQPRVHSIRTDSDGRFRMEGVGLSSRFWLSADRGNGEQDSEACEPPDEPVFQEEWSVELQLSPPCVPLRMSGLVLLPSGEPAPRATVVCGDASTTTDASGRYTLELRSLEGDLYATRPGSGIAVLTQPDFARDLGTGELRGPDLRLPRSALALEGRVVDRAGEPLAGAQVLLADGTRLPTETYNSLEDLAAGRTLGHTRTDEAGRFRLDGLLERSYSIAVRHEGQENRAGTSYTAGTVGIELVVRD